MKASWLTPGAIARQTAIESAGGMRLPDGGFVDPFKLTLGFLVGGDQARRARSTNNRAINKITFTRKTATAFLDGGAITTTNLVICIGEPTSLFKPLKRHLRHEDRYAVLTEPLSAAVRAELGQRAALLTRHRIARRIICGSPPITARCLPAPIRSVRPIGCATRRWCSAPAS